MLFLTNASVGLCFSVLFYDAPVKFLNTALGSFGFGMVFYDAPVLYTNKMHQSGVYGMHGVRCANVLCAPRLSIIERTDN